MLKGNTKLFQYQNKKILEKQSESKLQGCSVLQQVKINLINSSESANSMQSMITILCRNLFLY